MALGAQRQDVLRLVMRESMILVGAGVAFGLGGAVASSRLVSSLFFGLAPNDPITMAGAITLRCSSRLSPGIYRPDARYESIR
jgi:ABC-type antimicrobial peptide transport system permease subunit